MPRACRIVIERKRVEVSGIVQGVGFRSFVRRLARHFNLSVEVCKGTNGVPIDIRGEGRNLDAFRAALAEQPPLLAHIDAARRTAGTPSPAMRYFCIAESTEAVTSQSCIPAYSALRDMCIDELFTEGGRRWRHPFICCTDCGPRDALIHRTPYHRAHTSMTAFALCERCAAEYSDLADRRFHAETMACTECGPTLRFRPPSARGYAAPRSGSPMDPVARAWATIARGEIVAVKRLDGFQLICHATNPAAVERLRERKRRPTKPLALLVPKVASAAQWVDLGDASNAKLLASAIRPIVVSRRLNRLGPMLPSTPIQYLLFHRAQGLPSGTRWLGEAQPTIRVPASANLSGEPLLSDSADVGEALADIANAVLDHDREIVSRCDDSVVLAAHPLPAITLRRACRSVPKPVPLPTDGPSVLALGAQMKSTVTLTGGRLADVLPYLGDLRSLGVCELLEETVKHHVFRMHVTPAAIACDLQPDLYSTRLAETLVDCWSVPLLGIQHHHAHVAAVLAENAHTGPALGLALDGFGWGDDGNAWGGELLRVESGGRAQRLGHLSRLPLPGADAADHASWRMAAALLHTLKPEARRLSPATDSPTTVRLYLQIERGFNCPTRTCLGRWFDAIAGLAGICPTLHHEGEAAMTLEALWCTATSRADGWHIDGPNLNLLPLARRLAALRDPVEIARSWHATLATALADWLRHAMCTTDIDTDRRPWWLPRESRADVRLARCPAQRALHAVRAHSLPPGDDALSYGQAWTAIQQLQSSTVLTLEDRLE
ncbi:carbamoyltransferase HypF [Paraburkholderia phymatum]|uniref:carbamoyltransferase HypF n=1 Tax=Paraburkholderia phymatum TaxID=148447 RepID=UPI0002DFEF8C|nr:carbamoyltransferase HypF [Paraburkholderia phymatum]